MEDKKDYSINNIMCKGKSCMITVWKIQNFSNTHDNSSYTLIVYKQHIRTAMCKVDVLVFSMKLKATYKLSTMIFGFGKCSIIQIKI